MLHLVKKQTKRRSNTHDPSILAGPNPLASVFVPTGLGLSGLQLVCLLNACTVVGNLDGSLNQVFLVMPNSGLLPEVLAGVLRLVTGILDTEVDRVLAIPTESMSQAVLTSLPSGLWNATPVNYYGTPVWTGYVYQPASQIIRG